MQRLQAASHSAAQIELFVDGEGTPLQMIVQRALFHKLHDDAKRGGQHAVYANDKRRVHTHHNQRLILQGGLQLRRVVLQALDSNLNIAHVTRLCAVHHAR